MKKYKCNLCGWEYDPAAGDPQGGVDAGTDFDNLPEGWTCPVCGAPRADFSESE